MAHHIANIHKVGMSVVVCINRFTHDQDEEIEVVMQAARDAGAFDCVVSNHWAQGGLGALPLAQRVIACCEQVRIVPINK